MYDVMIIDDEINIRERLKSRIHWKDIGIRLVCEAEDSDTARELFLLHRPKIIVTDIHIPIISGLELAKEILAIDPDTRFIVITGYSDFNYVKNSVKIGAIDLISKPIKQEEINSSLIKAVEYFEKIIDEQKSSQELKALLEENFPILREKYIQYLLNQPISFSEDKAIEKIKALNIDIIGKYYSIVLISYSINALSSSDADLILISLKNICDEMLINAGYKVYSFYDNNYRLNCLLSWEDYKNKDNLEEVIQSIHNKIYFLLNIETYSGIGLPVTEINKLHNARHEALVALNYHGVLGSESVICYKNIDRITSSKNSDKNDIIIKALWLFNQYRIRELETLIRKEIASILSSTQYHINPIRKLLFEFMNSVINECVTLGVDIKAISKYFDMYVKIFSSENVQFLIQYLLEFSKEMSTELLNKRSKRKNHLINLAKDYIDSNIGNSNLSLDMVSNNVGLSSMYFCRLFSKEENISFNDYINSERIRVAKQLLKETNLKVFEVSDKCGYSSPKHFNYVFKRTTGITPLEYRNSEKS